MRINIVTVFKTENCGSFLQAWALKEHLSATGNCVYFGDYKNLVDTFAKKFSAVIKCCLRLRFKRALDILKRTSDFKRLQKELKVSDIAKNDVDLYIFGSDTLWNFGDEYFRSNAAFFTGANIQKPCYAYSISVASTSEEVLLNNSTTVKNIQKFKRIAIRDSHTENVLSAIYPREKMIKTVDPTLLWDKETYIKHFSTKLSYCQKSLVVYYFGAIPATLWEALKDFAQKKNLKIVNVGLYEKQFDFSVVASPANFITAFANAEYIFTNTFHGCVFSTLFNKQFATDGIHKKKIEGFLDQFTLLGRIVSAANEVEKVLTTPVDYEHVNSLIGQERKISIEYLNSVICEEENHE